MNGVDIFFNVIVLKRWSSTVLQGCSLLLNLLSKSLRSLHVAVVTQKLSNKLLDKCILILRGVYAGEFGASDRLPDVEFL